jgi:fumarate reductase flavoprotein subunit
MHKRIFLLFLLSALVAWSLFCAQGRAQDSDKGKQQSAPAASQAQPGKDKAEARPFLSPDKPFLADRHGTLGLECSACHGEGEKKAVKSEKCLECHTSFEEVAKATKDLNPNPHQNHVVESGDAECTSCHHGHKANEIYCRTCHEKMTFERKAAGETGK